MQDTKCDQQFQALEALLALDDSSEHTRYPQGLVQPNDDRLFSNKRVHNSRLVGKQNSILRREDRSRLNSSKEELKQILKRLESVEIMTRTEQLCSRVLQPVKLNDSLQNQWPMMKSCRKDGQKEEGKANQIKKAKNDQSLLEMGKGGDDIRMLMKQKNYSANALNMKTLHILQQLSSKNYRCSSTLSKTNGSEVAKFHKRNIVAFLRKAA